MERTPNVGMLYEIKENKVLQKQIELVKSNLKNGLVVLPTNLVKFVFLCGANKNEKEISERRRALIQFAQKNMPDTQLFLAEKVFVFLQSEGHNGNILDVENEISKFADFIVIILESPSSFAELGAFSHKELRDKLIVINDSKFLNTPSFINLGPVKAIKESAGEKRIISYKMREDGVEVLDGIGATYKSLHEILATKETKKAKSLTIEECDPSLVFNKFSLMFIHDLIYLAGPLTYPEVLELCFKIFGKKSFKLKEHVGMLAAINAVSRSSKGIISSKIGKLFLQYLFDVNKIISKFRNITQKKHRDRLHAN